MPPSPSKASPRRPRLCLPTNNNDDAQPVLTLPPLHSPPLPPTEPPTPLTEFDEHSRFDKRRQQLFIKSLPTQTQLILNQDFGKPNNRQCFYLVPSFCHILLPLLRTRFLREVDCVSLRCSCRDIDNLFHLLSTYQSVDFTPLQDPPPLNWNDTVGINSKHTAMVTSALLHFDGNMGSVVRFVGGIHVGAHRNHTAQLQELQGKISPDAYKNIKRVWLHGVPNFINAESTQENFHQFRNYGNHKSVTERPEATLKAFAKDNRRGFNLSIDPRMLPFILHAHVSPQGLVIKDGKPDRPVFDCTFRPNPSSMAINDWTDKQNEPVLEFPSAFMDFLIHIYNLRITYPNQRIFIGDDDVSGAFRHSKSHPDLVSMNMAQLSCGSSSYLFAATGQNFGGTTTPQNWEPNAIARKQLAQYYWCHFSQEIVARTQPLVPALSLTPGTPNAEPFQLADLDNLNRGVRLPSGIDSPPPFATHVDDCMYAFVGQDLHRTVLSSVSSLYAVLGYPDPRYLNPLSLDKFHNKYDEQRRIVGWDIDSRKLSIAIPQDRRQDVIATLQQWLSTKTFTLNDAAILHGKLESISRYHRWGRSQFTVLRSNFRHLLTSRYHSVHRRDPTLRDRARLRYLRELPLTLIHRLEQLVARDHAAVIWHTRTKFKLTEALQQELTYLFNYLRKPSNPWSTPIGHIIPRQAHFNSFGDACLIGGGAVCHELCFWFHIPWDPRVTNDCQTTKLKFGINELEFIVVILQFVAIKVALSNTDYCNQIKHRLPNRTIPAQPVADIWCDNTNSQSWTNRASAKSHHGSNLVKFFAELTLSSPISFSSSRVSTHDNGEADFLSRVDCQFSHTSLLQHVYHKLPLLKNYNFFRPSSELMESLYSVLYSTPLTRRPAPPKNLGHFDPGTSFSFNSAGATA